MAIVGIRYSITVYSLLSTAWNWGIGDHGNSRDKT